MRVHLDTDIGGDLDDLCALAYLIGRADVDLVGVTSVLDDGGRRAGYARRALAIAGRAEVPVAAGVESPRGPSGIPEYGLPSEARYWPEPVAPVPGAVDAALDLLARNIEAGATLIAIGLLTNLALLERQSPGTLRRATVCAMGGSVRGPAPGFPPWDHEMDFNFQSDSEAARLMLESVEPGRLTLVPIEVTAQTWLRAADIPTLARAGGLGPLVAQQAAAWAEDERMATRYGRVFDGLPDDLVNFQHDPLACAVALGWTGARVETLSLAVSMEGDSIRLREQPGGHLVRVTTEVDGMAFGSHWLETVTGRA